MKLNSLSKAFKTSGSFTLSYNMATGLFFGILGIMGLAFYGGYTMNEYPKEYPITQSIQSQPASLEESELAVLTECIGRMEANLIRINALGQRLVEIAGLSPEEFNFSNEIPMGGAEEEDLQRTVKILDEVLTKKLGQVTALYQAIQTLKGHHELQLFGQGKTAASQGWISSFYGHRHDPFTGRKAWHAGVDIVGKEGAKVQALAGGVVSFAATKGGYGNLVEIQHANGLSTRYGHNKALLVQPGELVKKGQTIALLGSSGRSTGPHLHLEVHRYGEAVDPGEYFPDLKRR